MNGGLEIVFGWLDNLWSKVVIFGVMFLCYMVLFYSGLDKGICLFSNLNMGLCLGFMGYMLFVGFMVLILDNFVNGLGSYLGNFINMVLNILLFEKFDWMNCFILFYWVWVIVWLLFVGIFVVCIFCGCIIIEYVFGVLLVLLLLVCVWIVVFGIIVLDL